MAITPSYKVNKEGEEEYIDRPAVDTVQYNPTVDAKYQAAKAQAVANDKVEWPTNVSGQTDQGF